MPRNRYRLHTGALLRRLMDGPIEGKARHTVRSLAAAAGVSRSKVQYMISEDRQRDTVAEEVADRFAREVGCDRPSLFRPIVSASPDTDAKEESG